MALAESGMTGIHRVLVEAEACSGYLARIHDKQEKMLEIQLNKEEGLLIKTGLTLYIASFQAILLFAPVIWVLTQLTMDLEKVLAWLSPVNAAAKHQAFKRERQAGTGMWLFDLPEMINWLDDPNDALWIYGIPGAGKTTLSTLVVDEVLTSKRSNTVGTAYFYIRHDDKESHQPASVLGSIVCQLARQNSKALTAVMSSYSQSCHQALMAPDDHALNETLYDISKSFLKTYIMIDGLDECGSCFDPNRSRLLDVVAGFRHHKGGSIRSLIFSRDEQDIRNHFTEKEFHTVSIAATSADLRLFTNAWLGRIDIQSENLRIETVETLVKEANGM